MRAIAGDGVGVLRLRAPCPVWHLLAQLNRPLSDHVHLVCLVALVEEVVVLGAVGKLEQARGRHPRLPGEVAEEGNLLKEDGDYVQLAEGRVGVRVRVGVRGRVGQSARAREKAIF